jgi:5-methyltetrahydrofolate--homocysteine methyltransferase
MTNALTELLAEKGVLLADGATGTNLFNMGLESGDAPELWNTDAPDKIRALYQGSVDAGSDLFLTNSFGANASRLKLHDAGERAYELSRISAELGREVADASGRRIIVAGSVGPTGDIMQPVGPLSHEDAAEMFEATAKGLHDGGADLCWLETISSLEEFAAAADGFARAGVDWCGTLSFDTAGRTMMGVTATQFTAFVETLPNPPLAFGANCGTGASDLLRTVLGFSDSTRPRIAKGNAGIPKYFDGHIHYDGTPELMGEYARLAYACGARIIGGCCGTMPDHLRQMRKALDTLEDRSVPTLEEIVEVLGPFSSESDGTEANVDAEPRRPRRRRRATA